MSGANCVFLLHFTFRRTVCISGVVVVCGGVPDLLTCCEVRTLLRCLQTCARSVCINQKMLARTLRVQCFVSNCFLCTCRVYAMFKAIENTFLPNGTESACFLLLPASLVCWSCLSVSSVFTSKFGRCLNIDFEEANSISDR